MTSENDFFDLGDPAKKEPVAPDRTNSLTVKSPDKPNKSNGYRTSVVGTREGEIGVGVPDPKEVQARAMTAEEVERYTTEDFKEEKARLDMLASQLTQQMSSFKMPKSIRRIGMGLAMGFSAILALLLITQVTSTLASLATLPIWSQWVVGVLLAIVTIVILVLVTKLLILFFSLRKNDQIKLASLNALAHREELRALSKTEHANAKAQLTEYLREYEPAKLERELVAAGLLPGDMSDLTQARDKLLNSRDSDQPDKWIATFNQEFQAVLDRAAMRMIKGNAKKVGVKTAISPLPILDNAIVLTISLSMLKDLMTIYQLRASRGSAGLILVRVIGQAYLAGEIQDLTETLSESAIDGLSDHIGQITAKITSVLGSKTGEGLVNGILIWRLGRAAMQLLQPTI